MVDKGFASDNISGVHPQILKAINEANMGHVDAYGVDQYTISALKKLKEAFGNDTEAFFVFNGTGANVLALASIVSSLNSIICSNLAHLNLDECAAPENFIGCKLIPVQNEAGKLTVKNIKPYIYGFGDPHHAQPKVISITQSTELGTVYSDHEVKAIADLAHDNQMFIHMDGARLSNAAVSLGKSLKEISFDLGVDILTFGGTKNGLMFGEVVIFSNQDLAKNFHYLRKQGMQLSSKMRFISAQYNALFEHNLWYQSARHANKMAKLLESKVSLLDGINVTRKVQANAVFVTLPGEIISLLQKEYPFYIWDESINEVRWMCSFDTTEEDISSFVNSLSKALSSAY